MSEETHYVVTFTAAQRTALLDLLTTVMHPPLQLVIVGDGGRQDAATTPADLRALVQDAPIVEVNAWPVADDVGLALRSGEALDVIAAYTRLAPDMRELCLSLMRAFEDTGDDHAT